MSKYNRIQVFKHVLYLITGREENKSMITSKIQYRFGKRYVTTVVDIIQVSLKTKRILEVDKEKYEQTKNSFFFVKKPFANNHVLHNIRNLNKSSSFSS